MPIKFGYFKELGDTAYVDHVNQRFGVGIDSPAATLHVRPATDVNLRVKETGGMVELRAVDDANSVIDFRFDAWNYRVFTNGFERLTIDNSGSLGIGTASPLAPLHVNAATDVNLLVNDISGTLRLKAVNDAGSINDIATDGWNNLLYTNGAERVRINSGGSVGVGTASPAATALLDMTSTSKGFLPPRMTTTQRDAISSPATGLVIYNTTTNVLDFYNGTAWGAV